MISEARPWFARRGAWVQTYPRLKKIAEKIVSVQRLELRPRRSKGIRYIFSNIQGSCLLQGHMAGFK